MGLEIERKFMVADVDAAIAASTGCVEIAQGYLSALPEATVRVRVCGPSGFLTVKSKNCGAVRGEWEYAIPVAEARELLALSQTPVIVKTRYEVPFGGRRWEVDVFSRPAGVALAEVELESADAPVGLPPWVGREVTGNPRYYNSALSLLAGV